MSLCKHCKEEIKEKSKVCPHCGRPQKNFWFILERIGLINIVPIIAIIIAINQCSQARTEKKNAEKAAEQAHVSLILVDSLRNELEIKDSINRELVKSNFAHFYLISENTIFTSGIVANEAKINYYKNKLLELAIPDSIERKEFIDILEGKE